MYTRGAASDYDDWETEHENPGWGYENLLPLFKKVRRALTSGQLALTSSRS